MPLRASPDRIPVLVASCVALLSMGCAEDLVCNDVTHAENTSTIATLRFETEKPSSSLVEHGYDDVDASITPSTQAGLTTHEHTLIGLAAGLENWYRVVVTTDKGKELVCEGTLDVDAPPSGVPEYEVTTHEEGRTASNFVLISNAGQEDVGPAVLDRDGNVVWYSEKDDAIAHTQMEFLEGTTDLVYMEQDVMHQDATLSALVTGTLDGEVLTHTPIEGAHHAFVQLPDGTLATLGVDVRDWTDPDTGDEEIVVGDTIIELAPDGTQTEVWTAWDSFEVIPHSGWDRPYYEGMRDWTHANAIDYDPETDSYLVSLGAMSLVVEIERSTGEMGNVYGPTYSMFPDDSTVFNFQHGANWTDEGTLLLSTTNLYTHSIEYEVDREANSLTQVWTYGLEEHIFAAALGEAERLDNGNTMVSFGMGSQLHEVADDGAVVWVMKGSTGFDLLSSPRLFDDFYTGL